MYNLLQKLQVTHSIHGLGLVVFFSKGMQNGIVNVEDCHKHHYFLGFCVICFNNLLRVFCVPTPIVLMIRSLVKNKYLLVRRDHNLYQTRMLIQKLGVEVVPLF